MSEKWIFTEIGVLISGGAVLQLKSKKVKTTVTAIILSVVAVAIVSVLCFVFNRPTEDSVEIGSFPTEYMCESENNSVCYQTDNKCSAYASAYVMRHLGEDIDGESLYPQIKRTLGFVTPKSIVDVFENHGYSAKAFCGDINSLKQRISQGVPVIVFVNIPNDTHYAAVVGYDESYFYLADSLAENANCDEKLYNRKISVDEFKKIWQTDTVFPDNIYIAVEN